MKNITTQQDWGKMEAVLKELAVYRQTSVESLKGQMTEDLQACWIELPEMTERDEQTLLYEHIAGNLEELMREIVTHRKIREAKLKAEFDSTGMTDTQVSIYMIYEAQRLIDLLGADLNVAKFIKQSVHYKRPLNVIDKLYRLIEWTDKAGRFGTFDRYTERRPLTVQEVIERLMACNPNSKVMVSDYHNAELVEYVQEQDFYVHKSHAIDKILATGDFPEFLRGEMEEVVMIPVNNMARKQNDITTVYTKFFASKRQSEAGAVKWLFDSTLKHVDDMLSPEGIAQLRKKMKDVTTHEKALPILRQHINCVDVDGVW